MDRRRPWSAERTARRSFRVLPPSGDDVDVPRLRLPGRYNVANALLAAAVCARLGVDPAAALIAMATVDVPGRVQRVDRGQEFLAVVDYAHKPAALEAVLATLRGQVPTGGVARGRRRGR